MKTPRTEAATFQVRSNTLIPDDVVYRSFAEQLETELAEMRKAMSRVVNNIGNGSFAADDASHEWMTKEAPEEVRLYCNRLRRELAAAKAAHQKADEQWIARENELMTDSARWKHLWQEVTKELADAQADIAAEIAQGEIYKAKLETAERDSGIYCATLKLSAQKLRCDEHMVDHAVSDLMAKLEKCRTALIETMAECASLPNFVVKKLSEALEETE